MATRLPVLAYRDAILYALEQHATLIVVGETGSGKSTQVPKYLVEAGWAVPPRCIACVEPRVLAATSLAKRVSSELGCHEVGGAVGYAVRLDERWDPEATRLKFTTDGWLLRAALYDPLLAHYSVVVVDEVHERSVATDMLLGLLKKVQMARRSTSPLRLVLSSATAEVHILRSFFGESSVAVASVEGRQYPVDIFYAEQAMGADYVAEAARVAARIHAEEKPGDIIVYLPGGKEVDECVALVRDAVGDGCDVVSLYASVDEETRRRALSGGKRRTVVVATNIAETALTVPGVRYVVDPGFVRLAVFDPEAGCELAVTTITSRASAEQRAGRAGRVGHGKCYRLYTEDAFRGGVHFMDHLPPAIQRSDLTWPLLQLKALGVNNIVDFDLPAPMPAVNLVAALDELRALGALDDMAELAAPLGERLALAPLEPRLARALLASIDLGCALDLVDIAAVVAQKRSLRQARAARRDDTLTTRAFRDELVDLDGDHLTYINVLQAYNDPARKAADRAKWCKDRAIDETVVLRAIASRPFLRDKWLGPIANAEGKPLPPDDQPGRFQDPNRSEKIRLAVVAGFFARAATLAPDATYRAVRADRGPIRLDKTCVYANFGTPPEFICFCDYKLDDLYDVVACHVAKVHPKTLLQTGDYYTVHLPPDHPLRLATRAEPPSSNAS